MALDQNLLMKASQLHQQSEEFENQLSFIAQQIHELQDFSQSLKVLMESKESESLSSLGKGVYIKSEIKSKELFVEVGSGIIVKKTPSQTLEVIEQQIAKFKEMRSQLQVQNELISRELKSAMETLEKQEKA